MLDRFWEGELPLFEGGYYPPLELTDTDDSVMVKAELPGLKPEDIELSVEGSVLTMIGAVTRTGDGSALQNAVQ